MPFFFDFMDGMLVVVLMKKDSLTSRGALVRPWEGRGVSPHREGGWTVEKV